MNSHRNNFLNNLCRSESPRFTERKEFALSPINKKPRKSTLKKNLLIRSIYFPPKSLEANKDGIQILPILSHRGKEALNPLENTKDKSSSHYLKSARDSYKTFNSPREQNSDIIRKRVYSMNNNSLPSLNLKTINSIPLKGEISRTAVKKKPMNSPKASEICRNESSLKFSPYLDFKKK